jgi:hypothetical protein
MGTAMYKDSTYGNFAAKGLSEEDHVYGLECTENILKNLQRVREQRNIKPEHIEALQQLADYYKSQLEKYK